MVDNNETSAIDVESVMLQSLLSKCPFLTLYERSGLLGRRSAMLSSNHDTFLALCSSDDGFMYTVVIPREDENGNIIGEKKGAKFIPSFVSKIGIDEKEIGRLYWTEDGIDHVRIYYEYIRYVNDEYNIAELELALGALSEYPIERKLAGDLSYNVPLGKLKLKSQY